MQEYISVEEARAIVLDRTRPRPTERAALADAAGRTLAAEVRSAEDIPRFDNSAMDGYAVRSADLTTLPATLRVVEDIPAGRFPEKTVEPGTCARIMTGAPFPEGADAVAPVEWTEDDGDGRVRFTRAPEAGQHVRRAGKDVRSGEAVIATGTVVTPPVVGMLATLGIDAVEVRVPPRVAVVATGDELVDVTDEPGPGQIRNSNGPALAAQARAAGASPLPPLHARDDVADIRRTVRRAMEADVLVFSGGVSVGTYDYVKQVLEEAGMELLFWKVRQRPGKPLAFGVLGDRLVFGLPGNPVSSAMCFEQYVRPALARMLGRAEVMRPRWPAVLEVEMKKKPGLHYFARGVARFEEGRLRVRDAGLQGSNIYSSVVRANCIVHLGEALEAAPAGTAVEVEWLAW